MKKFKFPLEPLLRVRKIHENAALTGLAKVMIHVNRAEEEKTESKRESSQEMDFFCRKKASEISIEEYKMYNAYLNRIDFQISKAESTLEKLRPEMEREQQKVVEARRKKRVVEILKERKKDIYDYELKKAGKKELSELKLMNGDGRGAKLYGVSEKQPVAKYMEAKEYDAEEEFESADFDDEKTDRTEKGDVVSEYFKKYGMEDPRKKK